MKILDQLTEILGPDYVLTGADTAKWAHDWTGNYSCEPLAVVRPADTAQTARIMTLAHATGTAVVPVGGNTGLVGGTAGEGMILLSLDRLNAVEIDPLGRSASLGAGVLL